METIRESSASKNLLVVDDDPAMWHLARKMISKIDPGSRVECVKSAEEALRVLQRTDAKNSYDIVLADVFLGEGKTGIELAEDCADEKLSPRIVLMSGSRDLPTHRPVMQKPLSIDAMTSFLFPYLHVEERAFASPGIDVAQPSAAWILIVGFLVLVSGIFAVRHATDSELRQLVPSSSTLRGSRAPASVLKGFDSPQLEAARRRLLTGGLTPLLSDPIAWNRLNNQDETNAKDLFKARAVIE